MERTTISCSKPAKAAIEEKKREDESWDTLLLRLANEEAEPTTLDEIHDELIAMNRKLESQPTQQQQEAGELGALRINEIREAVREEVRNQFQDFLR